MTGNYWVIKVVEETGGLYRRSGIEIYNHRMSEHFWSMKASPEKIKSSEKLQELSGGDCAVFYLVEKGREGRFLGTATLSSGYRKLDPQEEKVILHKDFLDSSWGVSLSAIDKWQTPLPVMAIRGIGAFAGGRCFSQFFEGNLKKLKNQREYDTIVRQQKSETK